MIPAHRLPELWEGCFVVVFFSLLFCFFRFFGVKFLLGLWVFSCSVSVFGGGGWVFLGVCWFFSS